MITRKTVLLFILLFAHRTLAWNDCGHMAIAAMAYPQLSADAKQKIAALLQKNPDYAHWVSGINEAEKDRIAFMRASVWADAIKGNPDYLDIPDRTSTKSNNFSYGDKRQHRAWHYINSPFSPDSTALRAAKTPNLQTQIAALRRSLQADSDSESRSYSLVWLLHLVGDAHQPLHATSRYTRDFPRGDQGGNAVIVCDKTCNQDLHSYWDRALGTTRKPQTILRMIASYPVVDPKYAAMLDEAIWLRESAEISRQHAYAKPIGNAANSVRLDKAYKTKARDIAERQAALAGARLANLLNRTLHE